MNDALTAFPIFLTLIVAFFAFAILMMPIFIWIICARLKATNASLKRMEFLLAQRR